ncbi:hypothetical protein DL93DRAFT_56033 [Clavulina sp. PMI_390]|nr:hypothetical protein DL93DRAFT_56033 [Clavulina sp. PMI_390]
MSLAKHHSSLRMQDESGIGKYIQYDAGPFAGRCVRSSLQAYQKPDLGRKFAKRDRRPLDPPPVIRLRMYELLNAGTPNQREIEIPAEDIDISGLVAHVDLFAVEPSPPPTSVPQPPLIPTASAETPLEQKPLSNITSSAECSVPDRPLASSHPPPGNATLVSSVLFGSSFVHGVQMDWRGEPVVFFVFSDLSVRSEGSFYMRYRCFDLFSRTAGTNDVPVAAELFSATFLIYSTKEFPGLQASTALTKHLSRWGVRVNLRENDRRKPLDDSSDEDDPLDGASQLPKKRQRSPGH